MNNKPDLGLFGILFYLFMVVVTFGEAMNHHKTDNARMERVADSTISAFFWPLYVSYRIFDKGGENEIRNNRN